MTNLEEQDDLGAQIDANLGRNLKRAREARGISQAELARWAANAGLRNFHQTTIARIESGQRALRAGEAVGIARLLDTNLEWLAESPVTTELRGHIIELSKATAAFQDAAAALINGRRKAAEDLDQVLPAGPGGYPGRGATEPAGVTEELFLSLSNQLRTSSPTDLLRLILLRQQLKADASGNSEMSEGGGRWLGLLLNEYEADLRALESEEGDGHGEHQKEA